MALAAERGEVNPCEDFGATVFFVARPLGVSLVIGLITRASLKTYSLVGHWRCDCAKAGMVVKVVTTTTAARAESEADWCAVHGNLHLRGVMRC